MSSPNEDWYSHLVAQSRNDNIYTLIHSYLEPEWSSNHDLDFVTVRRSQLPEKLKEVPSKHLSKKLPQEHYCFPGNDYILLHNYQLTEYLYHAKWACIIEDFEGREFIELRYDWTEEAKHYFNYPLVYYGKMQPKSPKAELLPIQSKPPESDEEAALILAYDLLQKGEQREQALAYAEIGKLFLDQQLITVNGNSEEALQQLARRMMGYNIVSMVCAWNNRINKAAEVDVLYIHHPPMWDYLEDYIKPYLEILIAKKQVDYLKHLFTDKEFRNRFLAHYGTFVSLFIDDTYPLTMKSYVIDIINRVNNMPTAYL
jgi:hypothetical protein